MLLESYIIEAGQQSAMYGRHHALVKRATEVTGLADIDLPVDGKADLRVDVDDDDAVEKDVD